MEIRRTTCSRNHSSLFFDVGRKLIVLRGGFVLVRFKLLPRELLFHLELDSPISVLRDDRIIEGLAHIGPRTSAVKSDNLSGIDDVVSDIEVRGGFV